MALFTPEGNSGGTNDISEVRGSLKVTRRKRKSAS
jgi:hypothetical protein